MLHNFQYKFLSISRCRYLRLIIPLCSICSFLCMNLVNRCYAVENPNIVSGTVSDAGTISTLTGGTNPGSPTASLSLSKPNMTSDAVMPGSTATTSTNVTVNVSNAKSYELYLKVNKATMTNGSTTISAGNVTTDNTWGYKWDNASSYAAPSTSNAKLTTPALDNYGTSFTKALSFGAKFASNANPGHYTASGTLSLIATPRDIIYTLDNLTQMQQLSLAPSACANTPYLDGQKYSKEYTLTDVRDGNTYTVRKFGDGRCWMTENLQLSSNQGSYTYMDGRVLKAATSDFDSGTITILNSSRSDFTDANKYTYQSILEYGSSAGTTGYYNWYTATAGAGNSSETTNNKSLNTSICPKGWTLPSGGSNSSTSEFGKFATAESITSDTASSTKIQAAPYNFKYTGRVDGGVLTYTGYGYWWSSTAYDATDAYILFINSSVVRPGTSYVFRYFGNPVRCIARDS